MMGWVDLTEGEVGDRGRVKGGDLDFGLILSGPKVFLLTLVDP
jgi:hypothetical protein